MTKLTLISFTLAMFTNVALADDAAKAPAPAPAMEMPKPSKEVTDMGKAMAGKWKCTGQAMAGTGMAEVKANVVSKLSLDGFYVENDATVTMGKASYKFIEFTGYDGKKWHRYAVDNMNGAREGSSTGPGADGKTIWDGQGSQMGKMIKWKDTEEMGKDKSFHTVGEFSLDGGKTWAKEHDITCKK